MAHTYVDGNCQIHQFKKSSNSTKNRHALWFVIVFRHMKILKIFLPLLSQFLKKSNVIALNSFDMHFKNTDNTCCLGHEIDFRSVLAVRFFAVRVFFNIRLVFPVSYKDLSRQLISNTQGRARYDSQTSAGLSIPINALSPGMCSCMMKLVLCKPISRISGPPFTNMV